VDGLSIPVEFNGQVFVPLVQVELPEGTRCIAHVPALKLPPPVTEEHRRLWDEIIRQVEASPQQYPTVDEEMKALRGRP